MNKLTDPQLLADYATKRSEAAFAELVWRHVDLVHSAALRLVHDAHAAQDVTQGVFMALAQNARQLTDRPALDGWLHSTTRNLAANSVRSDLRRRTREQEAAIMSEPHSAAPDTRWEHIAPHLDEVLSELNEPDRDALLLRYFKNHDLRTVGTTLGISDDAAQKRVSRAVERLRELFAKRGLTVSASALVAAMTVNAVQAAPVGLVATIPSAVAAATITATAIATHTTTNWIAAKIACAIVAAAGLAGIGTHLAQQGATTRLQSENQNLIAQQNQLTTERDAALSSLSRRNDELEQLRRDKNELLKLRGEVGMLRNQAIELGKAHQEIKKLRASSPGTPPPNFVDRLAVVFYRTNNHFPKESWAFAGYDNPEAALATWTWAMSKGDKAGMLASLAPEAQAEWQQLFNAENDEQIAKQFAGGSDKIAGYTLHSRKVLSPSGEVVMAFVMDLPDGSQSEERYMKIKKIGEDWRIVGPEGK